MKQSKVKKLKKAGWAVGNAQDFLKLTKEETLFLELKLALSTRLKECRQEQHMTQIELAELLQSSQSRIAKMEAGDPSVSIDLLLRALFQLGTSKKELAKLIA